VYACLYQRRDDPPTDIEINEFVSAQGDVKPNQNQLQRRRRQVSEVFLVEEDRKHRYTLVGWLPEQLAESTGISRSVRFQVLQSGRCARCGQTVEEDDVKLVVDHVIPQAWGGSDDISNLQPLCQPCNGGKKDYYGTFDRYTTEIRDAVSYNEPHRRIAMLLLAFHGEWVPSELLGAVASAKQYQEDWQKRMRELRYLDWKIETMRTGVRGERVRVSYRASKTMPLPASSLAEMTRRIEKERAAEKRMKKTR
jgi:5-methylcytosine-specific restriction endonuclease McrA